MTSSVANYELSFSKLAMSDPIRTLAVQYFQLVDAQNLAIPPGHVLVHPAIQQALYERMFDESLTPLPPATYRTRVLKLILACIEESLTDPDEDVSPPEQGLLSYGRITYYIMFRHVNNPQSTRSNSYPLRRHRKLLIALWTVGVT